MSILIAMLLVVHGGVHIGFVCSRSWPFEPGGSWPALLGLGAAAAGAGTALAILAFLGFTTAALVAVGLLPARLWRPVVLVSAVASAALLVLFATPATLAGLVIDAGLAWVVVARGWRPAPLLGRSRAQRPLAR